jgi:hypothetical protein
MLKVDELLEALTPDSREHETRASSGFTDLDRMTGGLTAGCVWIVTGAPGQGRTTLLTQWAAELAMEDWTTCLVCPREPVDFIGARLMACAGKIPLLQLHRRETPQGRANVARDRLLGKPLHVAGRGQVTFLDGGDQAEVASYGAMFIDDADLVAGVSPDRVASFARQGTLVVMSMPRHLLVLGEGKDRFLDPAWARVADVVAEMRQADRYDVQDSPRPGEADFYVIKNRWGPTRSVSVGFQGHYARFVDIAPDEP